MQIGARLSRNWRNNEKKSTDLWVGERGEKIGSRRAQDSEEFGLRKWGEATKKHPEEFSNSIKV